MWKRMGYFRDPKWREKNRKIFLRYGNNYGKPIYSATSSPPNSSALFVPNRLTISTSLAYKSVKRFKRLGLFDDEGKITPLGSKIEKLIGDIEGGNFDPARYDDETKEVSVRAGFMERKIRKVPRYHPASRFAPPWLPLWLPPLVKLTAWLSYRSVPKTYANDYIIGDRISTLDQKKLVIFQMKAWFFYYVLRDRRRKGWRIVRTNRKLSHHEVQSKL